MKRLCVFLTLFITGYFLEKTSANPSVLPIFSEVYFDDNDNWTIELCNKFFPEFLNLNGCRIVTSTDTSTIKDGIEFKNNCILLTNNDLDKAIKLLHGGDCLHFEYKETDSNEWYYFYFVTFMWGDIKTKINNGYGHNALSYPKFAPKSGQSVCALICPYFQSPYAAQVSQEIVISSNPTLGYDFFNASSNCSISGYVKDKNNLPLKNAWISIAPTQKVDFLLPVQTDSLGHFSIDNLFIKEYKLSVSIPGNQDGKSIYRNGVFENLYSQDVLFENDSTAFLNIKLSRELPKQKNLNNEFNFNVKILSDSLVQFSFDTITNKMGNKYSEMYIFIANQDGKIIYHKPLYFEYPKLFNFIFLWNIHDRVTIEQEIENSYLKEYKSNTIIDSNEYYFAVAMNVYGDGFAITYIQKFTIDK